MKFTCKLYYYIKATNIAECIPSFDFLFIPVFKIQNIYITILNKFGPSLILCNYTRFNETHIKLNALYTFHSYVYAVLSTIFIIICLYLNKIIVKKIESRYEYKKKHHQTRIFFFTPPNT